MEEREYAFQTSKDSDFLIKSICYESMRIFMAWKEVYTETQEPTGRIVSLEHIEGSWPDTTVLTYRDMDAFIRGTTWLDYIIAGIRDDSLIKMIKEKGYETQS